MKILHILQGIIPSGIERLVLSMLQLDADNTYIFALEHSREYNMDIWPGLKEIQDKVICANLNYNGKINTIRGLRQTCKKLAINAIHSHYTGPLLYSTLATMDMSGLTHIHTEHDSWHLQSRKLRILEKSMFAIKKNIELVAISSQIQVDLKRYFPNKRSTLIFNGIDTNLYKPNDLALARSTFNLPPTAIVIGSAGRLEPVKGHQYLIKAMTHLPDHIHLALAGSGTLFQELTSLVQELDLTQRVHILGQVEQMSLFYQACNLFCLPSLNEGLPLTLLEAQATNLPTVCSNVGSCKEALDPDSSLMVAPKDSKAIAEACLQVLERKGNPRRFVIEYFSLDKLIEKYMQLYLGAGNDSIG